MSSRVLTLALLLFCLPFVSCSSGDSTGSAGHCAGTGSTFCLVSCSLGCTSINCAVTEIAPNQPLRFDFNGQLDPATVNDSTVSIQTPFGRVPAGDLIVSGSTATFVPDFEIVGGSIVFGFEKNQTYILTLPGGPGSTGVRSRSGDPLPGTISCNLSISRDPIDPNGRPPAGELVSPTQNQVDLGVPTDVEIRVVFDEIIDISGFQGATTATSPVQYRARPTNAAGDCDPNAAAVPIPGVPKALVNAATGETEVVLQPTIALPRGSCIEVEITNRITDLAGNPAQRMVFQFVTEDLGPVDSAVVEDFAGGGKLDRNFSSGDWNNGEAVPGQLGGNGDLGDFDVTMGTLVAPGVYEWSTEDMTITGSHPVTGEPITVTGQDITVADGVFQFSRMVLPPSTTMRFVGSNPPRFMVRGRTQIDGRIELNAADVVAHDRTLAMGQPAATAAPFGGAGGQGADAGDGLGNQQLFNGQAGETVQLVAGHAYGPGGIGGDRQTGTGGAGSSQYPADGMWQSITFNGLAGFYSAQVAAGGGGAGFLAAGGAGMARRSCSGGVSGPTCNTELGAAAAGGLAFDLFPIPTGVSSGDHFMVGGSGGGGGGSHPFWSTAGAGGSQASPSTPWYSGAAGAGGGGVVGFRVGSDFIMSPGSAIEAKGGSAANNASPPPAPGGGGSGGSVLVQVGGVFGFSGEIDVSGGLGGFTDDFSFIDVETRGGDGVPGFIRLEALAASSPVLLGMTTPPATLQNVGILTDSDKVVGSQSLWYSSNSLFAPDYLRYEIQVVEDGVQVVYSDDPNWTSSFGPNMGEAKVGSNSSVGFRVQGGQMDLTTGVVDPGSIGDWRDYVGDFAPVGELNLGDDDANGLRFQIIFDRQTVQDIVVRQVSVFTQS